MNVIDRFDGPYHFLSNFYPAPTMYGGILYATSEHAYQAAKSMNPSYRAKVYAAQRPAVAKRLGRAVAVRKGWNDMRIAVMTDIVWDKFTRTESLRHRLLLTGDATLIEGNTWGDRFWGQAFGEGANNLGLILMQTRARLAQEAQGQKV